MLPTWAIALHMGLGQAAAAVTFIAPIGWKVGVSRSDAPDIHQAGLSGHNT